MLLLAHEQGGLSARDISERMQLKLGTCYHLLNTLEHKGFIARDGSRQLRLGPRIPQLHEAYEATLRYDSRLIEFLDRLNRETGETSYLGAWAGNNVVSIAMREGRRGVRVAGLDVGYKDHAYVRALGRVMLAFRDQRFIHGYLDSVRLEALTPRTTIDKQKLLRALAAVRRTGVAVEREEFIPGVCCVAAPVFDSAGRTFAALSVSVPKARFAVDGNAMIEMVKRVAADASAALAAQPLD